MLLKENFSEEYIRSLQKDSKRDPVLLERTVYAFGLLEAFVAFRVKQEYLDKLLPDYLYLFFCRDEFDRYARYKSTGSATEFFNWEDMCAVPFEIPPMDFQQLVVNAYKVLNKRIETKQKINDNLAA